MMPDNFERRFLKAELCEVRTKDSSEKANEVEIEMKVTPFNKVDNVGWCLECIKGYALDETDMSDVSLLVNHDFSMVPLARYKDSSESSTLKYEIKNDGLYATATLDLENPKAKEVYSAIKRGDLTGMSFAFIPDYSKVEYTYDDVLNEEVRIIHSIRKIYEFSIVTDPAYTDTSVNSRSKDSKLPKDFIEHKELNLRKRKILLKGKINNA